MLNLFISILALVCGFRDSLIAIKCCSFIHRCVVTISVCVCVFVCINQAQLLMCVSLASFREPLEKWTYIFFSIS